MYRMTEKNIGKKLEFSKQGRDCHQLISKPKSKINPLVAYVCVYDGVAMKTG
jgi:hypothetical protein